MCREELLVPGQRGRVGLFREPCGGRRGQGPEKVEEPRKRAEAEEANSRLHTAPAGVGLDRRRHDLGDERLVPLEGLVQEVGHKPGVTHGRPELTQSSQRRLPLNGGPEEPQAPR